MRYATLSAITSTTPRPSAVVKKLKTLQKETKVAKGVALSVQDIEDMGKPQKFSGNIVLTSSECETLKAHAINSMVLRAENTKLKEQLKTAQKSAAHWKKQFDDLKEKAQPYLDALEIAGLFPEQQTKK